MWHLTKIPKVLHVYFGGEKLSYARYMTIESFRKMNPDWEIKFYYPKFPHIHKSWNSFEQKYEVDAHDYFPVLLRGNKRNVSYIALDFEELGVPNNISEVYKSDYLRWYLLSTEGGLWSDMDIVYFKSMNSLSFNTPENAHLDTGVCICEYGHSIGFMLASNNNLYYKYLWDRAKYVWNDTNYQCIGSMLSGRFFPTMEAIQKTLPTINAINIPMDAVYAYDALHIPHIYKDGDMSRFTNDSIGLHWYAGHNFAGDFLKVTNGGFNNPKTCVLGKVLAAVTSEGFASFINTSLLEDDMSILDLGCGDQKIINRLKGTHFTVDIWEKFKPDLVWNLNKLPLPFADNSFDVILILDVIEHLTKENGLKLLEEAKRVANKKIVIFTPLWWTSNLYYMNDPQSAYYGNKYEEHQSLWSREDFGSGWEEITKLDFIGNYYFGVWNKNE